MDSRQAIATLKSNTERPDKSAALKATYRDAALLRTLNDRLAEANSPDAVWHDAEDVFAELEAKYAR
ncbi:hypothetical protein [Propionivibrio sp.]|uniref:hypothetical protein n=1 Tax=Propionivibrio sp. TaxID=2212460 RepID=UPI003BF1D6F7